MSLFSLYFSWIIQLKYLQRFICHSCFTIWKYHLSRYYPCVTSMSEILSNNRGNKKRCFSFASLDSYIPWILKILPYFCLLRIICGSPHFYFPKITILYEIKINTKKLWTPNLNKIWCNEMMEINGAWKLQ